MEKQATLNIGIIGHVAHGKTTLVKALTGIDTIRFKQEKEFNRTIKLGYANTKIYNCNKCKKYFAFGSEIVKPLCYDCPDGCPDIHQNDEGHNELTLQRHISFVDCPGHETLMTTMLGGSSVMDGAILLIAANEKCPQPQTMEHLRAMHMMKMKNIIVIQNKIDLVERSVACAQIDDIRRTLKIFDFDNAPIIPIVAHSNINIDIICKYLCNLPEPVRDHKANLEFNIIRSFDVNKLGTTFDKMKGGVLGGTITKGTLNIGQTIKILPGIIKKNNDKFETEPIITKVISLNSEKTNLTSAIAGGLIGIGTDIDPFFVKGDKIVGQIATTESNDDLFVKDNFEINFFLFDKNKLNKNEKIMLNVRSSTICSCVLAIKNDLIKVQLSFPIAIHLHEKVTILQNQNKSWHLIGFGYVMC